MSVINADPADDVRIDWPLGSGSVDGPAVIGFARGGRSILLADASGDGTDLYRIDDAAQRAVKGRLADPQPVRLGHLPRHGLDVRISPNQRWALVVDRVENVQLVELPTGVLIRELKGLPQDQKHHDRLQNKNGGGNAIFQGGKQMPHQLIAGGVISCSACIGALPHIPRRWRQHRERIDQRR